MLLLKLLFLPFYFAFLPFKLIFGASSKSKSSNNSMDDWLDNWDYFSGEGIYKD